MRISDWSSDVFSSDLLSFPFLTIIEIADIAVEFMISDCCAERWQYRNGWKFLGQRKVQIPDAGAGRSQEQVGPSLKLVEGGKRRLKSEYPRVRAQHFIIAIKTECLPIEGSISHVIISPVIHGTALVVRLNCIACCQAELCVRPQGKGGSGAQALCLAGRLRARSEENTSELQ